MHLKDQICTLYQAVRLEQLLGEDNDTVFMWACNDDETDAEIAMPHYKGVYVPFPFHDSEPFTWSCERTYAAYTVSELGVMLPEYIGEWFLEMYKDASNKQGKEGYLIRYVEKDGIGGTKVIKAYNTRSEEKARAMMLIFILEARLITAEEVNNRLKNA